MVTRGVHACVVRVEGHLVVEPVVAEGQLVAVHGQLVSQRRRTSHAWTQLGTLKANLSRSGPGEPLRAGLRK